RKSTPGVRLPLARTPWLSGALPFLEARQASAGAHFLAEILCLRPCDTVDWMILILALMLTVARSLAVLPRVNLRAGYRLGTALALHTVDVFGNRDLGRIDAEARHIDPHDVGAPGDGRRSRLADLAVRQ